MYSGIALLLGHLVGDYWFQSHKMAINKSKEGLIGDLWCNIHCHIYSACMTFFVILDGWRLDNHNKYEYLILWSIAAVYLLSFITHYPIDRKSFAWTWMKWFGQSSFKDIDGELVKPEPSVISWAISDRVKIDKRQYFIAPIYIAIDNSMHLVLMWLLLSWLGKVT